MSAGFMVFAILLPILAGALIPLIPYYIYVMKKWSRGKKETTA